MTDFAKQVIVDNFPALPETMQNRVLRMMGINSIDQLDVVNPHRLMSVARHVTAYLLRPQRPSPSDA